VTATNAFDIYCDESGFTGENLLSPDQRFFAYGTVAITRAEASALVAKTIRDFRLQGNELKGKNLLKHSGGRKATAALLTELEGRSQARACVPTRKELFGSSRDARWERGGKSTAGGERRVRMPAARKIQMRPLTGFG
jgi:hypothetical protein